MIIGNLNHLSLAGLPAWVRNILLRPECSLSALSTREDGRWQPEGCRWFCTLGTSDTQPAELRHTEYHHFCTASVAVRTGCEGINAGTRPIARENDEERKPDLFIAPSPENSVAITLHAGDFAVFMPEEPHQALCAIGTATSIRKAVFKVPRDMLEA